MTKKKVKNNSVEVEKKKGKKEDKSLSKNKKNLDNGKPNEEKKKPQRGISVGENFGWTGKLPATLLHEHCQKAKWKKPSIDMRKLAKGFMAVVNLEWENPKTRETISVRMTPDADSYSPKETTNEARHFAATYALFRLNFEKNMRMVLPNIFREYWQDLDAKRKELEKSNKYKHDLIYNANPFLVVLEQREQREKKELFKQTRLENEKKENKPAMNVTLNSAKPVIKNNLAALAKVLSSEPVISFPRKIWESAPIIDLPSGIRVKIERVISDLIEWSPIADGNENHDNEVLALTRLGFRESHAKESFSYAKTFKDALEWLLFHIPEDDLPQLFVKRSEDSAISLKVAGNIREEYKMKRLQESGHDIDEIFALLNENNGDEVLTCVKLTQSLDARTRYFEKCEGSETFWLEEVEGLRLIFPDKVSWMDGFQKNAISVKLNIDKLSQKNLLSLRVFKSENYPNELPGIFITVNDSSFKLANYIKISIIRQLIDFLVTKNYIGDMLLDTIIDWSEQNIPGIIEHPGKLVTRKEQKVNSIGPSGTEKSKVIHTKDAKQTSDHTSIVIQRKNDYLQRMSSQEMRDSIRQRSSLPAWRKKENIVSTIINNNVSVITGETGSGKSTQVVQFLLEYLNKREDFESRIICTQPRRISAIGLAERISDERLSSIGDEVGYIIRGENRTSNSTRICFVTTGVLLRMIQALVQESKLSHSFFNHTKYIIVDEVHERSVDTDFLLIVLKKILKKIPSLRVILMSATVDTSAYNGFFNSRLEHIHIEGRTFPITDYYLPEILDDLDYSIVTDDRDVKPNPNSYFFRQGNINYDLIAKLCVRIDVLLTSDNNDGSLLIFMPGIMEINRCINYVRDEFDRVNKSALCIPLHSALASKEQKKVFLKSKTGIRKIVVSTNIAETSITIPDCVAVLDAGRSKSQYYDAKVGATKLIEDWCSKAEVNQRRGRAGRIQEGRCYHLYTNETFSAMMDQQVPEIKRTRLENLYLTIKSMGIGKPEELLRSGLDLPSESAILSTKKYLLQIGALENESLTSLGKYMSLIPADLRCGKLLVLSCIFGCLDICLSLASIFTTGGLFLNDFNKRDQIKSIRKRFAKEYGDFIGQAITFKEFEKCNKNKGERKRFITDNFLSSAALRDVSSTREQYLSILQNIGFVPLLYTSQDGHFKRLNRNSSNLAVVRALITASFFPQIARVQYPDTKYIQSLAGSIEIDADAKATKYWIRNDEFFDTSREDKGERNSMFPNKRAFLHPSSVLFESTPNQAVEPNEEFLGEDGTIDYEKARKAHESLKPKVSQLSTRSSFIVFCSANLSQKLYIKDLTPTSTIAVLLFGGEILYDLEGYLSGGKTAPGVILDNWIPVRTWCKNGVILKRLRVLLDSLIGKCLDRPHYRDSSDENDNSQDMLKLVEAVLSL